MATPTEQRQAEAQARQERLCTAYARVFGQDPTPGQPDTRSEDQRLVMADMEHRGYLHRSTIVPSQSGDVSALRMEASEGQRIFVLNTKALIRGAKLPERKQPVRVKRT
jgi:hypothetical protein